MTCDSVSRPDPGTAADRDVDIASARWRLILHGRRAADDDVREAVMAMRERGVALSVRVTWEGGDAARHVDGAIEDGIDTVIAAGGDGTLNETATALARHERNAGALPSLALLPLGTANDFATAAGVPQDPLEALRLVGAQPAVPLDLLRIEADGDIHWCVNVASGGFGTEVTVQTDETLKKALGGLAYLVTGIARLDRIEPIAARFEGPGFEWSGDLIVLGLGNGRQAGGGHPLCPDARVDDGALDVTVIPPLEGELGALARSLLTDGREAAGDRIAVRARLPWLRMETAVPMTLNLDGEPVRARRFRIECVPARLRMHLPPDCPLLGRTDAR